MQPEIIGKPLHWIMILQSVSFAFAYRYDPWYRVDTLRPIDMITDTVNDLGIKILQQYTAHGNVAFSPTGIAFVLIALYEGSAGRGNKQIAETMRLPLNRDITRIGFRDIHRRLRSYLNANGFLGGLMLNKENTKLRSEYEDILRFYGFDLSNIEQEANVTVTMENSNTTELSISTVSLTSPLAGIINSGNIPDVTTMPMNIITFITMLSSNVERVTVPSTATSAAQIVTIPTDINAQTISTVINSSTSVQRTLTTQLTDSLTVVTSDENVQSSIDMESILDLSRTINSAMNTELTSTTSIDNQTNLNTVTMIALANNKSSEMSPIIMDSTNNTGITGTIIISTDTQTILTPIASSIAVQNMTQSMNSLTTITSSESMQSLFIGAERMTNSSSTLQVLPMDIGVVSKVPMDQMNSNIISIAAVANNETNQNSQTFPAVNINNIGATKTANIITNVNITEDSNTNIQIPDVTIAVSTVSTNSDDKSISNKFNTSTSNMLMSTTSTILNSASTIIPNFVTNTIMNNINSQLNTKISTMANTTEVTLLKNLTTMQVNINNSVRVTLADETTMVPSVQEINFTSNNLVANSDNSANSTINSILDDQITINSITNTILVDVNQTLMNQSTILNNKKRTVETETTESNWNIMNNGITNKTINRLNKTNGLNRTNHKRRTRNLHGYFSSYPDKSIWIQDLEIWKSYSTRLSEFSMKDTEMEISFLVNGCDVSSVTASRYIAVLPFAYFPSLHAVALEFPLDNPRYNIILVMPTDKTDAHRLARDLSRKSLRLLRKQLQLTWVRATIPSFMLRGFVVLTSFLQKLGILDVFDPRVADLSPMTSDLGVYTRDIQQNIGINIKNYMKPDRIHSRNGLFERAGPVSFTALHPFLYFIVDTETSVSLIAGRIDDPLNSRIL